jgi:Bacteriophage HK97-gp10, putative tail-component
MGGFNIQIQGLRELERELIALGGAKAKKVMHDGMLAGARVIQAAITDAAPMRPLGISGGILPPGALKSDIGVTMKQRERDNMPYAVIAPGKYTWMVAMWVEYGHRMIRSSAAGNVKLHKKGAGLGVQISEDVPAHPFIRKGFEASVAEAVSVTVEAIARGIEREAGNQAAPGTSLLPQGDSEEEFVASA